jgi:hypothetical protein
LSNTNRSSRTSLKDWEDWLSPQIRQVELLGEVAITADECAQLGKTIGLRLRGLGHRRALSILERNYPCALAVYLVAQGIYGYRGGDYWSEVVETTNLKRASAWQVGQAFEAILEGAGLLLFYDMRQEAHRWECVDQCECGEETSCYECLRNYRNQSFHDRLQRGLARDFLDGLLQGADIQA